jgi:hypothetical protein
MSTFNNITINNDINILNTTETVKNHINDITKHRIINDSNILSTELWSASKINSELSLKEVSSNKGVVNGYAGLNANGVIPNIHIPPLAITKPILYNSLSARDADEANVQEGDVAIVIDVDKSYIYSGEFGSGGTYIELITTGAIASINGLFGGSVVIKTSDIPEETNLYYTEARVSANATVVDNTDRIIVLENDTTGTWYESTSDEVCTEIYPEDGIAEITSTSQGTSVSPINGTYRATFNAQFAITKGGTTIARCPSAILNLVLQLEELTYTAHAAAYGAGETLVAGNYYQSGATTQTGILNFDAESDPDAVFVINCGAAHAIAVNSDVVLLNGAQSCNIFWLVIGALSAGTGCDLKGTYVGKAAVGITSGCAVDGRLFTTNGAITSTNNILAIPAVETTAFDLGVSKEFVLFSITGDITNTAPASTIQSGIIAAGTGTVAGYGAPYDGTYTVDPETNPTILVLFGIYNDGVLVSSSSLYKQETILGEYFSMTCACTTVVSASVISARVSIESVKGSVTVSNRGLFVIKLL